MLPTELSEDPIGFDAGDANLYRYVGNGATGAVDPNELKIVESEVGDFTRPADVVPFSGRSTDRPNRRGVLDGPRRRWNMISQKLGPRADGCWLESSRFGPRNS